MTTKAPNKILLQDSFILPEQNSWKLNESEVPNSKFKVDGQNILARVQGPMFLVDECSLNKRRYEKSLWENTINKAKPKFENGGIPGTIGHDQALDEKALIEGKISHLLTNLWITEDKIGMGEIVVLGTDSGRQLNTCLRAGMPIPVSSRAYGTISGQGSMGEDIIDPDTFVLESFDFVLNPGVETAYPKVVENVKSDEDYKMSDVEKLVKEQLELQKQLNEATKEGIRTKSETEVLKEENAKLKRVVDFYKGQFGTPKEAQELKEKHLMAWLTLEPLKSLAKELGLLDKTGLKSSDYVKFVTESLSKLSTLASPEKVAELEAKLASHEEVGTPEEMEAALELLKQYHESGKPEQIKARLKRAAKIEARLLEVRRKVAAKKISDKFNIDAEVIYEMLKKIRTTDVVAYCRKLTEAKSDTVAALKVTESNKESRPALSVVKTAPRASLASKLSEKLTKVGNAS